MTPIEKREVEAKAVAKFFGLNFYAIKRGPHWIMYNHPGTGIWAAKLTETAMWKVLLKQWKQINA